MMGVDARIRLPANVRLGEVAECIGVLLGLKPRKEPLQHCRDGAWAVRVDGVTVTGNVTMPTCADINIVGATIGENSKRWFLYHFEGSPNGERLIIPRSTALNIAMGRRLVEFFGGEMDYSNCDNIDCDYRIEPKGEDENHPEDGEPWQNLQERILNLPPLTEAEVAEWQEVAAY
jgi:hypothetical protein